VVFSPHSGYLETRGDVEEMDGIRLRGMISHLLDARYLIWWFDISDVSLYGLTGDAAGGSIMTMINALSLSLSLSLRGMQAFSVAAQDLGAFRSYGVCRAGGCLE